MMIQSEILNKAENGDEHARDVVIECLTYGFYGFEEDPEKAEELKEKWIKK